jgi:site-specific DNA-methyltransferase (adenine-specific)
MPELPAHSVNLVAADLPYGTTAADWDKVIDFQWLWAQYERLLVPGGTVVLTASQPFTSQLVMSKPKWFRYELIWHKNTCTGFLQAKYRPMKAHENVLVFSPGRQTYNPQGVIPIHKRRSGHKNATPINSEIPGREYIQTLTNYPKSVLEFNSERGYHPTQKPVAMMEWIVRTYSNAGETVLDNTMGSGSTGVAAVKNHRSFIGIEMLENYFQIAQKRIERASCPIHTSRQ